MLLRRILIAIFLILQGVLLINDGEIKFNFQHNFRTLVARSPVQQHFEVTDCQINHYRIVLASIFLATGFLHLEHSTFVHAIEIVAVLMHIGLLTNPSIFNLDDFTQLSTFIMNLVLLTCIWGEIRYGDKRIKKMHIFNQVDAEQLKKTKKESADLTEKPEAVEEKTVERPKTEKEKTSRKASRN